MPEGLRAVREDSHYARWRKAERSLELLLEGLDDHEAEARRQDEVEEAERVAIAADEIEELLADLRESRAVWLAGAPIRTSEELREAMTESEKTVRAGQ